MSQQKQYSQKFKKHIENIRNSLDHNTDIKVRPWDMNQFFKADEYIKSWNTDLQMLWIYFLEEITDIFDSYLWSIDFRNIRYYYLNM